GISVYSLTLVGQHLHMETTALIFQIWLVHAVAGAALSVPILFVGRKRIGWARWESLALVIPFCIWALLMFSPFASGREGLANLGEPIYISFAMPVLALIRVTVGTRMTEKAYAVSFIGTLCGVAVAVFFLVPSLPE